MMQKNSFRQNTLDLSSEIYYMAKKEELGEFCKVYPVAKQYTRIWVIGQVFIAWGVLALIFPAVMIVAMQFSSRPEFLIPTLAIAVPALLLLMAGYYMSFSRRAYAFWQVSLWQKGFIYEKKRIRQAFRWNQIESVQTNVMHVPNGPSGIFYMCKVRHQDQHEVELSSVFSDIPELIDTVLEKSAHQLASQELSITSPRNISTFTQLKLDRQGIGNGQETLSWQEIQEFMTKNGTVTLRKKAE